MVNASLSVQPWVLPAGVHAIDYYDDRNQQFVETFRYPEENRGVLVTSDAFKRAYYFPNISAAAYVRDSSSSAYHEEWHVAAEAALDYYRFH